MAIKNKLKNFKKLKISNKLSYTIIAVVAIIFLSVGVYSLTPGTAPNPGHDISSVSPPYPCANGQYLKYVESGGAGYWQCSTVSSGGISTPSPCASGQYLQWTGSAWICAAPTATDTRFTITTAGLCYQSPASCTLTTETCTASKFVTKSLSSQCYMYTSSQLTSYCLTECQRSPACDGTQTSCSGGTTASYTSATVSSCEGYDLYCHCNGPGTSYSQEHYSSAGQRCI